MKRTTLRVGALTAVALTIPSAALAADLKPELAGHESVRSHMRDGARDVAKDRLVKRIRAIDSSAAKRTLRRQSVSELRKRLSTLRTERAYDRVPVPGALASIAACESGGNPRAIGGGGLYRGKYQFDHQTWAAVGGSGDPAAASESEQDMRAALLYQRAGSSPWPVCG